MEQFEMFAKPQFGLEATKEYLQTDIYDIQNRCQSDGIFSRKDEKTLQEKNFQLAEIEAKLALTPQPEMVTDEDFRHLREKLSCLPQPMSNDMVTVGNA